MINRKIIVTVSEAFEGSIIESSKAISFTEMKKQPRPNRDVLYELYEQATYEVDVEKIKRMDKEEQKR